MGINVGQVLRQSALRHGERVAIVEHASYGARHERTYEHLDEGARRVAAALQNEGLGPGARVALFADNGRAFVESWFGIVYAGATVVPVPTIAAAPELAFRLAHARCDAIVHDDARYEVTQEAIEELGRDVPVLEAEGLGMGTLPVDRPFDTRPEDPAMILYTSGTLGRTKGALISHASLALHTAALVHHTLLLNERDCVLGVLPLTHSYGIRMAVLAPFYAGARTVLMPKFDANAAFTALDAESVTWLPVVPTMLSAFLREKERPAPKKLAWCLSAGAPLAEDLRVRAEARLGCEVRQGYGLTEATFSTIDAPPSPRTPGSVGRPVWGIEVRVVGEDQKDVPRGEPGEIRVRGQNVMTAYLDDDIGTLEVMPDGWLATGDIGVLDEDGVLSVVDRSKDIVIRGGNNVYPSEIEDVLATHPDVSEVAVIGRPDPHYGEEIVAVVVPREGTSPTPASIVETCHGKLAPVKHPREVVFVPRMPLGASGKVLKRELRRLVTSGEIRPEKVG